MTIISYERAVLFIPPIELNAVRCFRKPNPSSENTRRSNVKSSLVKGKEAEWIEWENAEWDSIWRRGVDASDKSVLKSIVLVLVVAHHISSSLSRRYRNLSWQMTLRDYREREREFNISHISSTSTRLLLNRGHLSMECNMWWQWLRYISNSFDSNSLLLQLQYREWLRRSIF